MRESGCRLHRMSIRWRCRKNDRDVERGEGLAERACLAALRVFQENGVEAVAVRDRQGCAHRPDDMDAASLLDQACTKMERREADAIDNQNGFSKKIGHEWVPACARAAARSARSGEMTPQSHSTATRAQSLRLTVVLSCATAIVTSIEARSPAPRTLFLLRQRDPDAPVNQMQDKQRCSGPRRARSSMRQVRRASNRAFALAFGPHDQ